MRLSKLRWLFLTLGLLLCTGLLVAQSQTSTGGTFNPILNYVLEGTWTWKGASPLLFEGATNDSKTTTLTIADPTANRTWTLPDATDTVVGKATTDTLTNKTLTAPTLTTATLTTPVIATITNTGTLTLPVATGGLPSVLNCGSTTTGTATCTATAAATSTKIYAGVATLASNAQVITLPVAYAATTSFQCVGQDITTRANPVQVVSTSTTSITITNTTGASDVINWICVGQ